MASARVHRNPAADAARVRRLRTALDLTQRELAAELEVAHGAVAAWENGSRSVPGPVSKLLSLYEEELGMATPRLSGRPPTSMLIRQAAVSKSVAASFAGAAALVLERMLAADAQANAISAHAHAAIARRLVQTLGNLKGVAMKIGQTLAYADFALPEAARAELRELLTQARPMSPALAARVVLEDLGAPPRQLFRDWSPTPFAAGSIGQVHRARLASGEEVAVKIQYPAIVEAITADLASATLVDSASRLLFRGQTPGVFLAEMRERFAEECDYRIEAEHQERFRRLWRGNPYVVIPRVHTELSSRRVLVSALHEGESFEGFIAHASSRERDQAGMQLFRFAFESIFRHGQLNADPHPGNYLFSSGSITYLDFGCTKRFRPEQLARWRGIIRAVLERDFPAARRIWIELGMIPNPIQHDLNYHDRMLVTLYEPWLVDGHFRFTPDFVRTIWRTLVSDNPNKFRTNVPKDWVFINRLQWGLYAVLAQLGASGNYRAVMLDLLYEPGERRPEPFSADELRALLLPAS